jgi:hypothetical protein
MADERRRALLEELAYGTDARVTPETRLRASDALEAMPVPFKDQISESIRAQVRAMSDSEVREHLDLEVCDVINAALHPNQHVRSGVSSEEAESWYPATLEQVRYLIEARAKKILEDRSADAVAGSSSE